jgi:hypothetical protein
LQASVVHALSSLHEIAAPPWHEPPPHVSPEVQALPSSQDAVLFVKTHPVAGLQLSVVQALSSLHVTVKPPWHEPPPHASSVVQALPSSQDAVLFVKTHPVAGSQLSFVQPLPSLQTTAAPPWHEPPPHVSPEVQALPSSQGAVLFVKTHPVAGSQVSVVQALPSSHETVKPLHEPPLHESWTVQAFPSSQASELSVWPQPAAESHVSVVQAFASSQSNAVPPTQAPAPLHASFVVQTLPSLQDDAAASN